MNTGASDTGSALAVSQAARVQARLWVAQRASAVVLALAVLVHIASMIYAVNGGLSAAEILERTRGNTWWLVFYMVFVVAVAVHAPIGLRAMLAEWTRWPRAIRNAAVVALGTAVLSMGTRAAWLLYAGTP